jgi:hypothetical protein
MRSEEIDEGKYYLFVPHHEVGPHPSQYMGGHIVRVTQIKIMAGDGFSAPHYMVQGALGCAIEALPDELQPLCPRAERNLAEARKATPSARCYWCYALVIGAALFILFHAVRHTPPAFGG